MTDPGSHDRPPIPRGPEAPGADPDGVAYGDGLDPIVGPDPIDPGAPDGSIDLSDARGDVDAALTSSDDSAPTPEPNSSDSDQAEPRSSNSRRSWLPKRFQRSRSSNPDTDEASGPDTGVSDGFDASARSSSRSRLDRARHAAGITESYQRFDELELEPESEQEEVYEGPLAGLVSPESAGEVRFDDYIRAYGDALVLEAKDVLITYGKDSEGYNAKLAEIDAFLQFVVDQHPLYDTALVKDATVPDKETYIKIAKATMMGGIKDAPAQDDRSLGEKVRITEEHVYQHALDLARKDDPLLTPRRFAKWWNNDDRRAKREPLIRDYELFSARAYQLDIEKQKYDDEYMDPDKPFSHTVTAAYVKNRQEYIDARRKAAGLSRQIYSMHAE